MKVSHTADHYLEAMYFLAFPVGEYGPATGGRPAPAARVAEMLQVTPPTASEMLKRLEGEGLVERAGRGAPQLTAKGRHEAERVVRHHRLIERFLTDFMGYAPADCHEHAEALADAFDDEMIDRLAERLGQPDRCPHGWPVDPSHEQAENGDLLALSAVPPGDEATIVRLAEHDGDLLKWFYDEGFVPGTDVAVERVEPAAGQMVVRMAGAERPIPEKAAAGLFVRRAAG